MAAAEAMAAGLPILVSNQVPVGRWAQAAHAGAIVSNDWDEFAGAARHLLSLPREELRAMGARARRCAESQFDRRVVARMFLDRVATLAAANHACDRSNRLPDLRDARSRAN